MRMKSVDYDAIMIAIAADIDSFIPPKDDGTIILKRRFNSTGYGKVKDDCDLCHGEKRMHMGNFERAGKFYHFYAGCPVCEHDPNLQIQEEPIESETMESRIKFWRALAFTILCAIPVWAALMGLFVYFRG